LSCQYLVESKGETYHWRAAAPKVFVFVFTAMCTMRRQDLTPSLAPSQYPCMQPHFTSSCSPPTPLLPIANSVLAMNSLSRACRWALPQCTLRIERPFAFTQTTPLTPANTQPPHALATYTKEPWLYPTHALTKERLSVRRAQAPYRLASRWYPFLIHSSNGLGCIV